MGRYNDIIKEVGMKKRLVFISNMAAPYQVKFCYALQEHFDAEFWFYEHVSSKRPAWWAIPLGGKCRVFDGVYGKRSQKYVCAGVGAALAKFDPDIVMLGGPTIPANYMAYLWAKRHRKKTVLFSESFRRDGQMKTSWIFSRLLPWLYQGIDLLMAPGGDSATYFREMTNFDKGRIVETSYPFDIDAYWTHSIRKQKDAYTYLFSHRLEPLFNPMMALDIFADVLAKYPGSRMHMNAQGSMRAAAQERIRELGLAATVSFLDDITSWKGLSDVYNQADISLSPCLSVCNNGCMSIIEAAVSGCGLVISDQMPFNPGAARESGGGFVVPPNKESFLWAVDQYVENPDLFRIHAERSRSYFETYRMRSLARRDAELFYGRLFNQPVPASTDGQVEMNG